MISNKVLSGGTVLVELVDGKFSFDVKKSKRSGSVSTITAGKEPVLS